ncbi:MAG: DUF192 domain-containing protein [Clostridiaceae bacterium]
MILVNKKDGTVISENVIVADTFLKRLKGLMFTKELPKQDSMLLKPCNEIHMFFMNYSLDVLYLDKNMKVVHIDEQLKPGKIGKRVKESISVIELPDGRIKDAGLKVGDILEYLHI